MRILFAAREGFEYNRVKVLTAGLAQIAPDQFEILAFKEKTAEKGQIVLQHAQNCDVIYVPPFRRRDVAFIRKYSAGKPIVFDPLIGTYITRVIDDNFWWRGPYAKWRDRRDFLRADHLIFDTDSHRNWAIKTFGLDPQKCHTLYIGADTALFQKKSLNPNTRPLNFGFYGTLAPLQGVEVIMKAAEILKDISDIKFTLIGPIEQKKHTAAIKASLSTKHIDFHPIVSYQKLQELIQTFDVGLGIFGKSLKADVVIPNKIYHYAALGLPIITRNTKGMNELFTAGKSYIASDTTPQDLADTILKLKADLELQERIGQGAYSTIANQLSQSHIAQHFLDLMNKIARI